MLSNVANVSEECLSNNLKIWELFLYLSYKFHSPKINFLLSLYLQVNDILLFMFIIAYKLEKFSICVKIK